MPGLPLQSFRGTKYTFISSLGEIMAGAGVARRPISYVVLVFAFLSGVSTGALAAEKKPDTQPWKYNGAGSCAASGCHGDAQPVSEAIKAKTRRGILQNEY